MADKNTAKLIATGAISDEDGTQQYRLIHLIAGSVYILERLEHDALGADRWMPVKGDAQGRVLADGIRTIVDQWDRSSC